MNELHGDERRIKILALIQEATTPLNGSVISKQMGVSRQVIVQDIALLRANKHDIISTNRGYLINTPTNEVDTFTRVFKVAHSDDDIAKELLCIINLSGQVLDVFVDHDVYGKISVDLNISTTQDIENFVVSMQDDEVSPLKNITNEHHYHTVKAPTVKLLDLIEAELRESGFLCVYEKTVP